MNVSIRFKRRALALAITGLLGSTPAVADMDIDTAVGTWLPVIESMGIPIEAWEAEFRDSLARTSNEQVGAVIYAETYNQVQNILRGDPPDDSNGGAVVVDGPASFESIGDLGTDLVYTPVVPCRIFDTRNDADGSVAPAVGAVQNYFVYGSGATISAQGGNVTGCASPGGEPSAVAANFTVVPFAKGNIQAWPFLTAPPTTSLVNYNTPANFNIANAAIVTTAYLVGQDISVRSNFGQSHYLGDVMGYFYQGALASNTVNTAQVVDNSLTSADLAADSVGASEIQTGAVRSAEILDGQVTTADLANNAVTGAKITDSTITAADLATNSVGAAEIQSNAVSSSKILDNSITSADIGSSAVGASELATSAVVGGTGGDVLDNSITSADIQDGSISAADLATNSVGAAEIQTNAVGASEIAENAVGSSELQSSLTLGGTLDSSDDGELYLRDFPSGSPLTAGYVTFIFDGGTGSAYIGTTGENGELYMRNSSASTTVQLLGSSGDVRNTLTGDGVVKAWARINASGTINACDRCNTSTAETQKLSTGRYEVDFTLGTIGGSGTSDGRPGTCTLGHNGSSSSISQGLHIGCEARYGDDSSMYIDVRDSSGNFVDNAFTVLVF